MSPILWILLLAMLPAMALLLYMAFRIKGFSFHSIPECARAGHSAARWYLRIVYSAFLALVGCFLWVLGQRFV